MYKKKFLWFSLFLVASSSIAGASVVNESTNHLQKVMTDEGLQIQLAQFLDNVLKQTESNIFLPFARKILDLNSPATDRFFYESLLKDIKKERSNFAFFHQLKALDEQKKVLAQQAIEIIGKDKHIEGYVEIGTPCTYFNEISRTLPIIGTIYAMQDEQRLSDYAQAFS